MLDAAARSLVFAGCLLLSACTTGPLSRLNWRPGLTPGRPQQAADPELQPTLDRLYARGAAALAGNDLDAAIAAWRQYAAVAPLQLAQTRKVRGYLTLLERESARRFARQAAAGERSARYLTTDRTHVALFPFRNLGPAATAAGANPQFNRAVLAMVTVDLSRVPSLTVLEREKIDFLLQELKLADSGLEDAATLAARGRMLGAGSVVAGSVYNEPGPAGPGTGRYKINTAVSDVAGGRVVGVQEADGSQGEFHVLEKRIVYGILDSLEIRDVPAAVSAVHTRSWAAYSRFASGLALLAEDRYDEARTAFRDALQFDPGFALAEAAYVDTPARKATLDEIRAELLAAP